MGVIGKAIRSLARRAGYDITSIAVRRIGVDPIWDMQRFLKKCPNPVIVDVGANIGQSVFGFKKAFPTSSIYSFEPSPVTYEKLFENCKDVPSVQTWNVGVGSHETTMDLLENDHSDMSSFLAPGKLSWGKLTGSSRVPVITLDSFAQKHAMDFIHILKSDTQGFDFEVLKGAERLIREDKVALIFFEFNFSELYVGLPRFDEVFRFLSERNYELVTFYEPRCAYELLSWTEFLFISRSFYEQRQKQL